MSKMDNVFLAVNKNYFGLGLKSIDILIISQIEEFNKNDCKCFITNEQFSDMFGESISTIKRTLDKLDELKIIKRDTSYIKGNGKANKQRVLSVNNRSKWKVQIKPTNENCKVHNEPNKEMEGSNIDNGRFKSEEWKVHNEPIKEKEKDNKKDNICAYAPLSATLLPSKWILKDTESKEIFGSDIHSDERVMEILKDEFGKVEYGKARTIEDICKDTWVTACHVNTDKIAEYCTEVLTR